MSMKLNRKNILALSIMELLFIAITVTVILTRPKTNRTSDEPKIHLLGETHGKKIFYEKELEFWKDQYNKGHRSLFIELPYYTASFLDIWLRADDDALLDAFYEDIEGTQSHDPAILEFYRAIKAECPETRLYGTDVGHQYDTTGERYLEYLRERGLEDSEDYRLAEKNIEQGRTYRENYDSPMNQYREDCMVANFVEAFYRCGESEITGIYGSYHTDPSKEGLMAYQLENSLGAVENIDIKNDIVYSRKPYSFGFCVTGLIFLLMLFIPNSVWTRFKPEGYDEAAAGENKILAALERAGQVIVTAAALMFTDFNPDITVLSPSIYFTEANLYLIFAFLLMVLYEIWWIRWFAGSRTMKSFYTSLLGIPLAGATLPVMAFFLLGIFGNNLIMVAGSVVLGIGHIGIHAQHSREIHTR